MLRKQANTRKQKKQRRTEKHKKVGEAFWCFEIHIPRLSRYRAAFCCTHLTCTVGTYQRFQTRTANS
eukprot:203372-Pelagomonas_calceolata.AAC.1